MASYYSIYTVYIYESFHRHSNIVAHDNDCFLCVLLATVLQLLARLIGLEIVLKLLHL